MRSLATLPLTSACNAVHLVANSLARRVQDSPAAEGKQLLVGTNEEASVSSDMAAADAAVDAGELAPVHEDTAGIGAGAGSNSAGGEGGDDSGLRSAAEVPLANESITTDSPLAAATKSPVSPSGTVFPLPDIADSAHINPLSTSVACSIISPSASEVSTNLAHSADASHSARRLASPTRRLTSPCSGPSVLGAFSNSKSSSGP